MRACNVCCTIASWPASEVDVDADEELDPDPEPGAEPEDEGLELEERGVVRLA